MAMPKFNELSPGLQIVVILAVGAALWTVTEYLMIGPLQESNEQKQTQIGQLERENAPLRPFEERVKQLITENKQLELQLETLRTIVPDEKEVDSFMRLVEGSASTSGVNVRRFTARPAVPQEFYVEVPFELELDGRYYDVMQFYDRLGRLARIINVSDLRMGSIQASRSIGNKAYEYSPGESVVAICVATTFFSTEASAAPLAGAPGQPPQPAQ